MVRKINYGKILLVIFLTVLIWVWADLALDDELPVSGATISIAKSTNPNLWVSFNDESFVSIDNIVLKGPASRIGNARRKLNDGSLVIEFFLDAEQEGLTDPGKHPLDVLAFLKKSRQIKELGLTVESCEPDKLSVNVVKLVEKKLTVKCFDEDGIPLIKAESIPSKVDMFVPEHWAGEALTAEVRLTRSEIEQARLSAIVKKPYIELVADQTREAATTVEITTPLQEDPRSDCFVTATLAIALSPNLQGKYKVVVSNLDAVMERIAIRATPDAKRAYELQPYAPMTLYIFDDDAQKGTEEQRREVVYNFPPEFVRKGEIELKNPQQPAEAKFKLIPLSSAAAPSNE